MATIQHFIDIKVPVHTVYNQLTQFEDYPRFMEDVEAVQQLDDTHLHWKAIMSSRPVEWDAEITEQQPDRCIAWRNTSGPTSAGKVEVQSAGPDASRVTLTLEAVPAQASSGPSGGNGEAEMSRRLKQDLARLKEFIEARGSETGAWRGEVRDAQVTMRDRDAKQQHGVETGQAGQATRQDLQEGQEPQGEGGSPGNSPVEMASYAAGSEGWSGEEDYTSPVVSSSQAAAEKKDAKSEASRSQPTDERGTALPSETKGSSSDPGKP